VITRGGRRLSRAIAEEEWTIKRGLKRGKNGKSHRLSKGAWLGGITPSEKRGKC